MFERRESEKHNSDGRVRGVQREKKKTAEQQGTEEMKGVVGEEVRVVDERGGGGGLASWRRVASWRG